MKEIILTVLVFLSLFCLAYSNRELVIQLMGEARTTDHHAPAVTARQKPPVARRGGVRAYSDAGRAAAVLNEDMARIMEDEREAFIEQKRIEWQRMEGVPSL